MKSMKILLAATALVISLGAYSQQDSTKKDTLKLKTDTTKKKVPQLTESATTNTQDQQSVSAQQSPANTKTEAATATSPVTPATNTTATSQLTNNTGSNTPKPNFGRYYIPVLGSYNAVTTTTENKSIKISGDENNPGKVWVEGLSGSKFYALLKTVPGTYKIPAQKEEGNNVAEGTIIYDENSKQVSVCIGCGFDAQAPAVTEAIATSTTTTPENAKTKKQPAAEKVKKVPVISFTGTKADQGTASLLR